MQDLRQEIKEIDDVINAITDGPVISNIMGICGHLPAFVEFARLIAKFLDKIEDTYNNPFT